MTSLPANKLLTPENRLDNVFLHFIGAEVQNRRKTDHHTTLQSVHKPTASTARKLLSNDHFMEVVELLRLDVCEKFPSGQVFAWSQTHGIQAIRTHALNEIHVWALSSCFALFSHWHNVFVGKFTHLAS